MDNVVADLEIATRCPGGTSKSGVVNSVAGTSFVRRGDVIKTVNKQTVTNLTEFIELYERLTATGDEKVLLQIAWFGSYVYIFR